MSSGVMPPRTGRRHRQNQDGMQGPTQGPFVGESSTLRVRGGAGNEQFVRTTQEIGRPDRAGPISRDCPSCGAEYNRREKSVAELSHGTSTASGFRGREQRRFTPGINISSRQDFKNRSGGQASRNVSYGSVFQRQSQRIPSQPTRSTVRSQPGQESVASTVRQTPCMSCGKNHQGQCLVGAGVCYQCGQQVHCKKDCPQLNMTVQRDQGVGSQTVEQSRVSVVPTEGTKEEENSSKVYPWLNFGSFCTSLLEQIRIFIGCSLMKKTGQLVFTRNQESVPVQLESLFGMEQVKEVVYVRFWKWICFEGYLNLCTGNQIYMSSDHEPEARDYRVHISWIPLLMLSVLRNNDAVVSAGRAPLHCRACKRCCTGCTLHNVSLGLPVKSLDFELITTLASSSHESFKQSRQIQSGKKQVEGQNREIGKDQTNQIAPHGISRSCHASFTCRALVRACLSPVVSSNLGSCNSFLFFLFNWANPRPDPSPFLIQFIIFPKINCKMAQILEILSIKDYFCQTKWILSSTYLQEFHKSSWAKILKLLIDLGSTPFFPILLSISTKTHMEDLPPVLAITFLQFGSVVSFTEAGTNLTSGVILTLLVEASNPRPYLLEPFCPEFRIESKLSVPELSIFTNLITPGSPELLIFAMSSFRLP
uniref:CCHC-type domain-containing protein n=1 Tax=Cucumis melo TaxID=3656 RepID=A0A9I9E6V8_CUCME